MDYGTYAGLPASGQYYAALGVIDALGKTLGSKFVIPTEKIEKKYPTLQTLYPVVYLMRCEEYLWAHWEGDKNAGAVGHLWRILVDLIASIPEEGIKRLDKGCFTAYYRALREAGEELEEENG